MVLAQLTKVVFKLVKTGEFDFAKFLLQVGCQVLMLQQLQRLLGVGVVEGVESSMFAVATILPLLLCMMLQE